MDAVSFFGYWTLSDLMDERANFDSMYHGGYGLFTYNGVPKSGLEALRLMNQLGNTALPPATAGISPKVNRNGS